MDESTPCSFLNPKLTIELIPQTSWFDNVRSRVTTKEWDFLRKRAYEAADNKCEICGGQGRQHPVECHERWLFDDEKKLQKLEGLIALCPPCHKVKHIGLAEIRGDYAEALDQLCKVNGWDSIEATEYVQASFELWHIRSRYEWTVDISMLDDLLNPYRNKRSAEIRKMAEEPIFDFGDDA